MSKKLTLALAGNPNSGKTTIFNSLTGARQHVGNYAGVTVEKKEGTCRHKDIDINVIDLPGTYSLTAYSAEEVVARDYLVMEKPDVVVQVVDASNLERNLYLAVQLKEMGVPLVLAFNMSDAARSRGLSFDLDLLSRYFGATIVETVGHKGLGMQQLLDAAVETANRETEPALCIDYGEDVENEIRMLENMLKPLDVSKRYGARWLAVKMLEADTDVIEKVGRKDVEMMAVEAAERIMSRLNESAETAIAGSRYGFISGATHEAVQSSLEHRVSVSDKIDSVMTNRLLGLPIFAFMMYLVFQLTFTLGEPPMGWIESLFGWMGDTLGASWAESTMPHLRSLVIDGIIGGVGGVIVFVPNIVLLFIAISLLEDTGYMARAAFIMDRLMHKIGLHGKSFIPMLIGFGCSVPAIMATRTLDNRRDRLVTMLVTPLMSCGARLPIYVLIIPAFFPQAWQGTMLWVIYVIGILLAILTAKLLRSTILKGDTVPFVMELPPYRIPTMRGIAIHTWERTWLYLRKAGTIILGVSILLWAMTSYPQKQVFDQNYDAMAAQVEAEMQAAAAEVGTDAPEAARADAIAPYEEELVAIEEAKHAEELAYTVSGRIGHGLEPVLSPLGFDWKIGTALIGAFAAKEVFVAQMGIVYSVGEADEESVALRDRLRETYSPLIGFCIMLFCLISAPCMATIAVTRRESGQWRWAMFQLIGLTILAYIVVLIVYQAGSMLGIGI